MHESSWIIWLEHNDLFQLALGSYLPGGASSKKNKSKVMFLYEKKNASCCNGLHLLCLAMSVNWSTFFVENAFCYSQISWDMTFHGFPNWATFASLFRCVLLCLDFRHFSFSSQHFLTIFYVQMVLYLCSTKPATRT